MPRNQRRIVDVADSRRQLHSVWLRRACGAKHHVIEVLPIAGLQRLAFYQFEGSRAIGPSLSPHLVAQTAMLEDLSDRVARYQRSFSAGGPKASDRDRAALIAAIG